MYEAPIENWTSALFALKARKREQIAKINIHEYRRVKMNRIN